MMSPVRKLPLSAEKETSYMRTVTHKENAQTNCDQEQQGKIIALWPPTKVSVKRKKNVKETALEEAFSYRVPMEVTQILKLENEEYYPVCPRCETSIEREYMSFCNCCGQKLGWKKRKDAVYVYPGFSRSTRRRNRITHLVP